MYIHPSCLSITYTMPTNQKRKGPGKRKRAQQPKQNSYATARIPSENGEMFAVVTKFFGGSNVEVMCYDGKERLCIIRRKFRGRHKRSNEVTTGSLILVGLYEWQSASTSRDKCDLLCVYSNEQTRTFSKEGRLAPALLALLGASTGTSIGNTDDHFEFINESPNDTEFSGLNRSDSDSDTDSDSDSDSERKTPPVNTIMDAGAHVSAEDI